MGLKGSVAPWAQPIIGDALVPSADVADAIEQRALHLLREVDPGLAKELMQALTAARWLLPLIVLRLPPARRLPLQRRELALRRCVNPPLLLRPLRVQLRGIARALKLIVVFPHFTQDPVRRSVGYVDMHDRPRAKGLDLTPKHYPDPGEGTP